MVLLKMEQFPLDLNIKEISMINITRQRIGIYYKNREWGKECFEHILSKIPQEMIDKIINSKNEMSCRLINGDTIRAVCATESSRGCKFTCAIVQDNINNEIMQKIIYPCISYPVARVKDIEELTANYVAIKQELPRKKFVKIKVRY